MNWLFDNHYDSFAIIMDDWLALRGLTLNDITAVLFMVKRNKSDEDADAIVSLTLGEGVEKLSGANENLVIQFKETDFDVGGLEVTYRTSKPYIMGLGVKTSTLAKYLEVGLEDEKLEIHPDFIHD